MLEKKLKFPVGITIFVGAIMKLIDSPYGALVFTIGFTGYFFLKILKLSKTPRYLWIRLHTIQVFLIAMGFASILLMYFEYPYSRAAFATFLLLESLVNLKIMINTYVGDQNFKMIIGFIGKLLKR